MGEVGGDVHAVNHAGDTALHFAVTRSNLEIVEYLVGEGQVSVHAVDRDGDTPLHLAARKNRFEAAKYLVANGAFVNAVNRGGYTPLHLAAVVTDHLELTKYLVANGAFVHAVNMDGETPLHIAAWWGRLATVKYLVDEGKANIFMRNSAGELPVKWSFGREVFEYLQRRAGEQILAAARNALHKIPDDVFMYLTTFLSV